MSELVETRLAELEQTIERGLATFIEVGQALLEIRDSRLYRESHGTFEDYCRERWGFSRQRGHQLIEAAEVSTVVDVANEAQARELAPLKDNPDQMAEAWSEANRHGLPTGAKVREAVARRMDVHYSSKTDEWGTPQELFDELNAEFGFDLDVCASTDNAKCERFYTREQNGLFQPWHGTCWMNPPYSDIGHWVETAHRRGTDGTVVVALVPARVDTRWWWDHCLDAEIRFLRGRLKFGGGEHGAPFPSAVVIFGHPYSVKWWERG